jgi:hypothetical protein
MSQCGAASAVALTAAQSVKLFGWWRQPILTLSWNDVKQHAFTWRQMRALGLEAGQLRRLQPDKHEWLQRGGIQVSDLLDMTVFPVNPLTDFGVDLTELWALRCSAGQMAGMGITFDHLVAKGITPQIMAAFAMPLSDWSELQFCVQHAETMREDDCQRVFALGRDELLRIVRSFAPGKR